MTTPRASLQATSSNPLEGLQGYDTLTIGHDTPVDRSAIDSTITYQLVARFKGFCQRCI